MMNNPNVFSALAYIKTSDNPLKVFLNYICYSMHKLGGSGIVAEQILSAVGENFGIKLSPYVFETCKKSLLKSRRIRTDRNTFTLIDLGFDLEKFESEKLQLQQNEEGLIKDLLLGAKTGNRINEMHIYTWA